MLEARIRQYSQYEDVEAVIQKDAIKHLIALIDGNPRMLLQAVDFLWRSKNQNQIKVADVIQNDMQLEIANKWYIDFYGKQAKRYKTNLSRTRKFLDTIVERLKDFNQRNEKATIYFALSDEICDEYTETINLLIYSRIITKVKLSSFGGSNAKKGLLYSLTPIVGCYYSIFTKKQIAMLPECIKYSIDKDIKVQFSAKSKFKRGNEENIKNGCPRMEDGKCINCLCDNTYSENWSICPYNGMSLDIKGKSSKDITIDVLDISNRLIVRLNEAKVKTLHDIISMGKEGLEDIPYIKNVRSNMIFDLAKEYIDDNL